MARNEAGRLLRKREQPRQASILELFFDLGIIFAFMQLSQRLLRDLAWINFAQTLILLAAVWWVWIATAWSTDWFNPAEPLIQRLVLGVLFAGLLMAAAIPGAFDKQGIVFAGAYTAIHIGRGLLLIPALRGHPLQRRTILVAVWFGISAIPWLIGAFLPESPRLALWFVAIAIDYGIAWLGWRTPWLGRVQEEQLRTIGEHLSERYRQVFIIALGEVILVSGLSYSRAGFDYVRTLAFAISFVNVLLLLWMYLTPGGAQLGGVIDHSRPRIAVLAAYCHMLAIAGIVLSAVGAEVLIAGPLGATHAAWSAVILGGSALFLLAGVVFDLVVFRRITWPFVIGLFVTLAMTPGMLWLPPLAVAGATNLVLFAIGLNQTINNRPNRSLN